MKALKNAALKTKMFSITSWSAIIALSCGFAGCKQINDSDVMAETTPAAAVSVEGKTFAANEMRCDVAKSVTYKERFEDEGDAKKCDLRISFAEEGKMLVTIEELQSGQVIVKEGSYEEESNDRRSSALGSVAGNFFSAHYYSKDWSNPRKSNKLIIDMGNAELGANGGELLLMSLENTVVGKTFTADGIRCDVAKGATYKERFEDEGAAQKCDLAISFAKDGKILVEIKDLQDGQVVVKEGEFEEERRDRASSTEGSIAGNFFSSHYYSIDWPNRRKSNKLIIDVGNAELGANGGELLLTPL